MLIPEIVPDDDTLTIDGGEDEGSRARTTSSSLTISSESVALSPELIPVAASAKAYAINSRASNTKRAYTSQWRAFEEWCADRNRIPLPATPETVALYVTERADGTWEAKATTRHGPASAATLSQAVTAIAEAHRILNVPTPTKHPTVTETIKGIRRKLGTKQSQKSPLLPEIIRTVFARMKPNDLVSTRDKAIITFGFSAAMRRCEISNVHVEDITFEDQGMLITITKSKTDQEGKGEKVGVPFAKDQDVCPVRWMKAWLDESGITTGPVFRAIDRWGHIRDQALSGRSIARNVVKPAVRLAGLNAKLFAGHSLRAGLATAAAKAKKPLHEIKKQGRWKSSATVDKYVRDVEIFTNNAADGIL